MKTIYVPKGETVTYESVVTENLIVHGCLNVTYSVQAKHICGNGTIHAGTIAADTIRASDLECSTITCEKLIAKRVSSAEVFASDSAVVSCFLSAAYVETGFLAVTISEINEVKAEQVVNLKPKKRGMLRLLFASSLKALWLSMVAPSVSEKGAAAAGPEPAPEPAPEPEESVKDDNAKLREEIFKSVREILAEQRKADASKPEQDQGDFELQRFVGMFKLCRESGYTLRLVPGTPEENAPVFDFDSEQINRPAA